MSARSINSARDGGLWQRVSAEPWPAVLDAAFPALMFRYVERTDYHFELNYPRLLGALQSTADTAADVIRTREIGPRRALILERLDNLAEVQRQWLNYCMGAMR